MPVWSTVCPCMAPTPAHFEMTWDSANNQIRLFFFLPHTLSRLGRFGPVAISSSGLRESPLPPPAAFMGIRKRGAGFDGGWVRKEKRVFHGGCIFSFWISLLPLLYPGVGISARAEKWILTSVRLSTKFALVKERNGKARLRDNPISLAALPVSKTQG